MLIETIERHTGWPAPRAESRVTFNGKVPVTGVDAMSACMRSAPEASTLRVNWLKGIEVFPATPATAT